VDYDLSGKLKKVVGTAGMDIFAVKNRGLKYLRKPVKDIVVS